MTILGVGGLGRGHGLALEIGPGERGARGARCQRQSVRWGSRPLDLDFEVALLLGASRLGPRRWGSWCWRRRRFNSAPAVDTIRGWLWRWRGARLSLDSRTVAARLAPRRRHGGRGRVDDRVNFLGDILMPRVDVHVRGLGPIARARRPQCSGRLLAPLSLRLDCGRARWRQLGVGGVAAYEVEKEEVVRIHLEEHLWGSASLSLRATYSYCGARLQATSTSYRRRSSQSSSPRRAS